MLEERAVFRKKNRIFRIPATTEAEGR